jgi:hypothetical protein
MPWRDPRQFGLKLTLVSAYLWRTALDGTTRPSAVFNHSAYTANKQLLIGFGCDLWAPQNKRHLKCGIEYSRFPAPFYGIGPNTPQSAEELFTPLTFAVGFTAQREFRSHTFVQFGWHVLHASIKDVVPGGLLSADTIPGSTGYTEVAPEVGLVFDSRDQLFDPKGGAFIEAHVRINLPMLGGSTGYQLYLLDARVTRRWSPAASWPCRARSRERPALCRSRSSRSPVAASSALMCSGAGATGWRCGRRRSGASTSCGVLASLASWPPG